MALLTVEEWSDSLMTLTRRTQIAKVVERTEVDGCRWHGLKIDLTVRKSWRLSWRNEKRSEAAEFVPQSVPHHGKPISSAARSKCHFIIANETQMLVCN